MSMTRRLAAFLLSAVLLVCGACGSSEGSKTEESSVPESRTEVSSKEESSSAAEESSVKEVSSVPESSPEPTVPEGNLNPLTGLYDLSDEAVGKRPIAIMINNIKDSLPQYGIAGADILFEMPVESGITRMMALWGDYTKIPNVCSVRSCRYYYPIFAAGFDAVYISVGGSDHGMAKLRDMGLDHFDGTQGDTYLFDRDAQRLSSYDLEHTMYVKGENIPSAMELYGMRSDLEEEYASPAFRFNDPDEAVSNTQTPCEKVTIWYSQEYYSTFTYNKTDKLYYKEHSGEPHMVEDTGTQLAFTNVLILETDIWSLDGYLLAMDCTGGDGYYISNGVVQKIHWEKPGDYDRIEIVDEDGQLISINAGKTYIGVTDYDTEDFE